MRKINKNEFQKKVKDNEKSPWLKNFLCAYAIGGLICVLGQCINDVLSMYIFKEDMVSSITSIILIFLSGLFTGLGLYEKLAKYAGGGTLVPITGFANAMVSPAIEFKNEGFIFGVGAKMFVIAGPVIVYGLCASVGFGLIYYLFTI